MKCVPFTFFIYYSFRFASFDDTRSIFCVKLAHSKVLFGFESLFLQNVYSVWLAPLLWNVVAVLEFKTFCVYMREKKKIRPCYFGRIWKYDISFVNIKILWIKLKIQECHRNGCWDFKRLHFISAHSHPQSHARTFFVVLWNDTQVQFG